MANRFFVLAVCLLGCLLHTECAVFIDQDKASTVLHRYRRENTGLLEEVLQGNLERECIEEICDYEEAREVFEDDDKTRRFWIQYRDSSCSTHNGGCNQICENSPARKAICSCIAGYRLKEDQKTCEPTVPFPCGRISASEVLKNNLTHLPDRSSNNATGGLKERSGDTAQNVPPASTLNQEQFNMNSLKGEVPWQVYMFSYERKGFCGGSVINEKWILTAAHCLEYEPHTVVAGEYNTDTYEFTEELRRIVRAIPHPAYSSSHKYLHDIALLELDSPLRLSSYVTPVCIADKAFTDHLLTNGLGTVSGWWRLTEQKRTANILQVQKVRHVDQATCLRNTTDTFLPNMFCVGPSATATETHQEQSGGPYTTNIEGTFILTGISTCGEQCTRNGKYSLYTGIGDYVQWIKNTTMFP